MFQSSWKHAIVTTLLKKAVLDETSSTNYQPVANLPFLSNVVEHIVHKQMIAHLVTNNLLQEFQSAYRNGHSKETQLRRDGMHYCHYSISVLRSIPWITI